MARMHSRKKGKAGSKPPISRTKPTWVRYKPRELEMLVTKLAKEGYPPSKIGMLLRDRYGVPNIAQLTGKNVLEILSEKGLSPQVPEELNALIEKAARCFKHFSKNKHDMTAKRGLLLTESKIRRLEKYFKRIGRLPSDWRYTREQLKITV